MENGSTTTKESGMLKYHGVRGGDSPFGLIREAAAATRVRPEAACSPVVGCRDRLVAIVASRRVCVMISMIGWLAAGTPDIVSRVAPQPRRPGAKPLASRRARSEPSLQSSVRIKRGKLFKIHVR